MPEDSPRLPLSENPGHTHKLTYILHLVAKKRWRCETQHGTYQAIGL